MNKIIASGSSPLMSDSSYAGVVAKKLGYEYVSLCRPINTNQKISRKILSYPDYHPGDFVVVEWTSTVRYEFRTEHGWTNTNPNSYKKGTSSFEEYFYEKGPGQWEYSGVYTALKEIITTQAFLKSQNIDYLFTFFYDDVLQSVLYLEPECPYLASLKNLVDQQHVLTFDGHGVDHWFRLNQCEYADSTHPAPSAHTQLADYILKTSEILVSLSASRNASAT